jgi:hypothetical protein
MIEASGKPRVDDDISESLVEQLATSAGPRRRSTAARRALTPDCMLGSGPRSGMKNERRATTWDSRGDDHQAVACVGESACNTQPLHLVHGKTSGQVRRPSALRG